MPKLKLWAGLFEVNPNTDWCSKSVRVCTVVAKDDKTALREVYEASLRECPLSVGYIEHRALEVREVPREQIKEVLENNNLAIYAALMTNQDTVPERTFFCSVIALSQIVLISDAMEVAYRHAQEEMG